MPKPNKPLDSVVCALAAVQIAMLPVLWVQRSVYESSVPALAIGVFVFVLVILGERVIADIPYGTQTFRMSWSELSEVVGALLLPPIVQLPVQALGVLTSRAAKNKQITMKDLLNTLLGTVKLGILSTVVRAAPPTFAWQMGTAVLAGVALKEIFGAVVVLVAMFRAGSTPNRVEFVRGSLVGMGASLLVAATTFGMIGVAIRAGELFFFLLAAPVVTAVLPYPFIRLLDAKHAWERHSRFMQTVDDANASVGSMIEMLRTRAGVERVDAWVSTDGAKPVLHTAASPAAIDVSVGDEIWQIHSTKEINVVVRHSDADARRLGLPGEAIVVTIGNDEDDISVWVASAPREADSGRVPFDRTAREAFAAMCWAVHNRIDGRRRTEEIEWRASHDPLTGLANREQFMAEARTALVRATPETPVVIAMVDVDAFKAVNDTWGHAVGDQFLLHVSDRLLKAARPGEVLVARLAGDEFAVAIAGVDRDTAESVLSRMSESVASPFRPTPESEYTGSASIGYAWADADESVQSLSELLAQADAALYRAKSERRNGIVRWSEQLDMAVQRADEVSKAITEALATGTLHIALQPIVPLDRLDDDGKMAEGDLPDFYEVLARIPNISPGEFIPVAERTSQIHAITLRIIELTCTYLKTARPEVGVAVNFSPHCLLDELLPARLEATLRESGIDPSRLTVEITETFAMSDETRVEESISRLRALGVHISIDDFGTGHSTLSRVLDLPADELKIDRSLLLACRGQGPDGRAMRLLSAVVKMANDLGFQTVMEGIETVDDLQIARALRPACVQGYLIGYPLAEFAGPSTVSPPTTPKLVESIVEAITLPSDPVPAEAKSEDPVSGVPVATELKAVAYR